MTTLWSEADLAQFNRELDDAGYPAWRREMYETLRRQNCPTYAEARAYKRGHVRLYTEPLRVVKTTPGHVTALGIERIWEMIRRLRKEHTALIAAEKAA